MLKVLPIHVQKACIILKNPYIIIKRTLVERWTLKEFLVKAWKEMRNIWKLEEKQSLLFRVRKFSWILFHSIWKAELVSNDLECLAEEISKQSVKSVAFFFFLLLLLIVKCESREREIEERTDRQKRMRAQWVGKLSAYPVCEWC